MKDERLWDRDKFFELEEAPPFHMGVSVIESRYQPSAFIDSEGTAWAATKIDGKLVRQVINVG